MKFCIHCNEPLTPLNTTETSFGYMGDVEYNECANCEFNMNEYMNRCKRESIENDTANWWKQ